MIEDTIKNIKTSIETIAQANNQSWNHSEQVILNMYLEKMKDKKTVLYSFKYTFYYDKKTRKRMLTKSTTRTTMPTQAALFYMVKRKLKQPMSLDEVATIFEIERNVIGKKYMKFKKQLEIKNCEDHSIIKTTCMMQPKPSQILTRKINSYYKDKDKAEKLLKMSVKIGKQTWKHFKGNGQNTYSYCAGLLYICNVIIKGGATQREVADIFGMTEVATRKAIYTIFKELEKKDAVTCIKNIVTSNHNNKAYRYLNIYLEKYPNDPEGQRLKKVKENADEKSCKAKIVKKDEEFNSVNKLITSSSDCDYEEIVVRLKSLTKKYPGELSKIQRLNKIFEFHINKMPKKKEVELWDLPNLPLP